MKTSVARRAVSLVVACAALGWIAVTAAVPCGPGESWIRYWRPIPACYDIYGSYCSLLSWNYGYA